ncbi:ParB/RepB/Spo0J family partition protein [Candidatus Bathyarchaeota archaeon]|nr:ParB/RepB/Spo0J family partition protein [Candidatus Bathyarchaeota archaeon]
MNIIMVPIDRLRPLFMREVSSEGLEELAQSIKFTGILEPLVVRASDYGIIAGYRRYLASQKAGLTEVPCILVDCDDAEAFRLSLIENIQRENLSDYEMAKRLKEFKEKTGFTEEQIGALIGKTKFWVSHHLAMLKLEGKLSRDNLERLDERHARVILSQPEEIWGPLMEDIARTIAEKGEPPSVREIERMAKKLQEEAELPIVPIEEIALEEVDEEETSSARMVELKTPEDIDRFFDEILRFSEGTEEDVYRCPCGCGWSVRVDWKNRMVEWIT